jgi:large subunit ribosomal protein L19
MQQSALTYIESKQLRKDLTAFRTGDTVRVHWKVREGEKERVQPFEGVVIRKTKGQNRATFTVRKMSYGVGVERIFPLHSPRYERVEVLTRGAVNRNRLFYLRDLMGKASRVETEEEMNVEAPAPAARPAPSASAPAEVAAPAAAAKAPPKVAKAVKEASKPPKAAKETSKPPKAAKETSKAPKAAKPEKE